MNIISTYTTLTRALRFCSRLSLEGPLKDKRHYLPHSAPCSRHLIDREIACFACFHSSCCSRCWSRGSTCWFCTHFVAGWTSCLESWHKKGQWVTMTGGPFSSQIRKSYNHTSIMIYLGMSRFIWPFQTHGWHQGLNGSDDNTLLMKTFSTCPVYI